MSASPNQDTNRRRPADPETPAPAPDVDPYAARPLPESFDEFVAQLNATQDTGGSVLVDEGLWEEVFGSPGLGQGARASFIAALPRPKATHKPTDGEQESCPVCLQPLHAIETEEEYALASDNYFGDPELLGLRVLPCPASHIICGRCAGEWLSRSNTCPLCRAQVDPAVAPPDPEAGVVIDRQRHTEELLQLFHGLFGPRREPPRPTDDGGRESFAGMYS